MSVSLGGRWKEIEQENISLRDQVKRLSLESEECLYRLSATSQEVVTARARLRELGLRFSLLDLEKQNLKKKNQILVENEIPLLQRDSREWSRMEVEDCRSQSLRFRDEEEKRVRQATSLSLQKDDLRRKLRELNSKLKVYREWKEEAESTIAGLKAETRALSQQISRKDELIRRIQREKISIFSEVTKLRAKTPVDLERVEKENKELARKIRQLEVPAKSSTNFLMTSKEVNPWAVD